MEDTDFKNTLSEFLFWMSLVLELIRYEFLSLYILFLAFEGINYKK